MFNISNNCNKHSLRNCAAISLISLFGLAAGVSCKSNEWYLNKEFIASLTSNDIGLIKEVKVNNQMHKVRLIGIDHDVDVDGNKLHTTWEFANLISDEKGESLAWQWLDTNDDPYASHINGDYPNSSMRKILCGSGEFKGDVYCATNTSDIEWDPAYKNKTILEMLPESLRNTLKKVKKTVITGEDYENISDCSDKLFILSRREIIGDDREPDEEGKLYEYYEKNNTKEARIKKQVNSSKVSTEIHDVESIKQIYKGGLISSYAGFNRTTDETEGGIYWLRTPNTKAFDVYGMAYNIDPNGDDSQLMIFSAAYNLAPCFCL